MRLVIKKGKQKELIEIAKNGLTWEELSKFVGVSASFLRNDLKNESRLLSRELYQKLSQFSKVNFNEFILQELEDNWGRSKGGKNSKGNTKNFLEPSESIELAELFGIILGDGHVDQIIRDSKVRIYTLTIAGDSRTDKHYLENYVSNLFKKLFRESGKVSSSKCSNSCYLKIHGKKIIEFLVLKGINPGNKKNNNQKIPDWILNNQKYLIACLRGLIDADGCVYYISKATNKNIRITFTSYIPALMQDVRTSFIKLGFHPSKVIRNEDIYLSSKQDVDKYLLEIGFSNDKHLKRLQNLRNR